MGKVEWNVVVFDKPGVDRTPVRQQHIENIPKLVNDGIFLSAGPIYHDVEKTKFAGSSLQLLAESREEVIEILKKDIFYSAGIWDLDNVIANPVTIAVRLPQKMPGVTVDYNAYL